jgi:probable rRNA maturation factor
MQIQVDVWVQDCWHEALDDQVLAEDSQPPKWDISSDDWSLWFCRWLEMLKPERSPIAAYEVGLRLTTDADIQTLNAQYRQQDKPTDVLAFAALEADCPAVEDLDETPLYLGDIVISIDTAQRQAQTQGHSLQTEVAWLASHGLLHLLGWDHPDEESLQQMLREQQDLLHTVGLSVGDG